MQNDSSPPPFPSNWRDLLSQMEKEWERLHQEIAQLRAQRSQLLDALFPAVGEEFTLSDEEILAQVGHEKPLREFLEEMGAQLTEK